MADTGIKNDSAETQEFTLPGRQKGIVFARLITARPLKGMPAKDQKTTTLYLHGDWTLDNAAKINSLMDTIHKAITPDTLISIENIDRLDTTGAILIRRYAEITPGGICSLISGFKDSHKQLLDIINTVPPAADTEPAPESFIINMLVDIGKFMHQMVISSGNLLSFIGLTLTRLFVAMTIPGRLKLTPIVHQLDRIGVRSLGIVGLISFLIGAVMVNQGSIQLEQFGASIFVIDMLGILQFRELGVLLASIIIAGRSGSSFTAQIGSMKLREEVDAMRTLGMNPVDVLVLPRLIALTLALPLLTFFADLVGIFGGMLMAWGQLGITPASFISYFRDAVSVGDFMVGMIKAPFNALVIVVVGCYQGLTVEGSAESLGANTTRSVVQAIFLVIVLDAFFAIFFSAIGL